MQQYRIAMDLRKRKNQEQGEERRGEERRGDSLYYCSILFYFSKYSYFTVLFLFYSYVSLLHSTSLLLYSYSPSYLLHLS
jgi:hypothetical protein